MRKVGWALAHESKWWGKPHPTVKKKGTNG